MVSTSCPLPAWSQSFDSWVERYESSVGRHGRDGCVSGDTLLDLAASLPSDLTAAQQERAARLLARLFCRFVSTLDRRIVSDLARGALTDDELSEWFAATHRLAGLVVRASGQSGISRSRQAPPYTDARVARALAEIDRHFTNPQYGLGAAARRVALSGCRLTQLLKVETGRTFGAHLHQRRIAEARTLLDDAALSVKEIASRVGYQSTSQLDRHFKKIAGSLPSAYRAASKRRSGAEAR
jgi:AraC-like DNA-binding protein